MTTTVVESGKAYEDMSLPRWPWVAGLILSLLGMGISGYLTYEHYTGSKSLACPAAGTHSHINCLAVTTSSWSMEHGVPVAVLGLVFFFVMIALQSPMAWRSPLRAVRLGRVVWCLVGVASALKLIYDELYKIDAICEWCTSIHLITFLVFVVTALGTASSIPRAGLADP